MYISWHVNYVQTVNPTPTCWHKLLSVVIWNRLVLEPVQNDLESTCVWASLWKDLESPCVEPVFLCLGIALCLSRSSSSYLYKSPTVVLVVSNWGIHWIHLGPNNILVLSSTLHYKCCILDKVKLSGLFIEIEGRYAWPIAPNTQQSIWVVGGWDWIYWSLTLSCFCIWFHCYT